MSHDPLSQPPQPPQPQYDETQIAFALAQLRAEQNFPIGIAAGMVGALLGAVVWAFITVVSQFQIGWMAIGIGFLVGFAIRKFGKGLDKTYGYAGAALSLFGCLLGNLLAVCGMLAAEKNVSIFAVLASLDLQTVQTLMKVTFSPMDLLFYGIATYEGYKLSFRQVSQAELLALLRSSRADQTTIG